MDKKFYEDAYLAPSIDVINLSLESSVLLEASDGSTIESYSNSADWYEWDAVSKSRRM